MPERKRKGAANNAVAFFVFEFLQYFLQGYDIAVNIRNNPDFHLFCPKRPFHRICFSVII